MGVLIYLGVVLAFIIIVVIVVTIGAIVGKAIRMLLDFNFRAGDFLTSDLRCPKCRRYKGKKINEKTHSWESFDTWDDQVAGLTTLKDGTTIGGARSVRCSGYQTHKRTTTFYKCQNCKHTWDEMSEDRIVGTRGVKCQ